MILRKLQKYEFFTPKGSLEDLTLFTQASLQVACTNAIQKTIAQTK